MNPDELFALLSVRTVNLAASAGGGRPLLTSQDLSHALGYCEDQFAARIYHATYAADYDAKEIDGLLARALFEEWRSRVDRYTTSQLALAAAEMAADPVERRFMQRRARVLETCARAALWPKHLLDRPYVAIRHAVIAELRKNNICVRCQGAGKFEREDCANCAGAGRLAVRDRQRAIAIKVLPSSYARTWRPVYDWLFWLLVNAIDTGRTQLQRVLG
jgi:hypothetical protein